MVGGELSYHWNCLLGNLTNANESLGVFKSHRSALGAVMLAYEGNADVLLVSAALDALQKTKAQYPKARLAITTADMGIVLLAQAPGATKNVILRLFSHRSATVHVTCQQAYLLAAWTGLEAVRKTNLGALVIRIGFWGYSIYATASACHRMPKRSARYQHTSAFYTQQGPYYMTSVPARNFILNMKSRDFWAQG